MCIEDLAVLDRKESAQLLEMLKKDRFKDRTNTFGNNYLHLLCKRYLRNKDIDPQAIDRDFIIEAIKVLAISCEIDFTQKNNKGKTAEMMLRDCTGRALRGCASVANLIREVAKEQKSNAEIDDEDMSTIGF